MKLFTELKIKFDQSDWSINPEFGLIDTILEQHPELLHILKSDITRGTKESNFGRKDTPSVEQIVRASLYKELKGLDYRELEYHQRDSRICSVFIKIDELRPYSFQMYQKYISKIRADNLKKFIVELNKIAINEGLEDIKKIRQDSTVVKSNIHYPTNNSLVWDCIKESHRLLESLSQEIEGFHYRDYTKSAKRTYYKINIIKSKDKRVELFKKQLILFTKTINQVSNAVKKKSNCSLTGMLLQMSMEEFIPTMQKVYSITERKEIRGESVPNKEKIFSIYEIHTDIIVKGGREVLFGHKVNLATGTSNLILDCDILQGNPSDSNLYQPTIERVTGNYGIIPRDSATDGGYASKDNAEYSKSKGIKNIVFNKIVGSLKNIVSSKHIETILKKWRSGIEAVISNLKRGFDIFTCNWKGWGHFQAKVLWSVIGYNIRVMTSLVLQKL